MKFRLLIILFLLTGFLSQAHALELQRAFPNLGVLLFPVDVQNAGDGSNRLFVIEEEGIISVFRNDRNVSSKIEFLNIQSKVTFAAQYGEIGETGLVSLAFHPDYKHNGYFYVNYLETDYNVIARYRVSATDSNKADPNSEQIIGRIAYSNSSGKHVNQIAFGPDGYLYVAVGDDDDEYRRDIGKAQDLKDEHGKILRLDVDHPTSQTKLYSIPADNPYVGNNSDYLEEIYAFGFHNPRKICFDPEDGTLWVADAGWLREEEINIVQRGNNCGWNIAEGNLCLTPVSNCSFVGLTPPVYQFEDPTQADTREVMGGILYRGANIPELQGSFIYVEKEQGKIFSLQYSPGGGAINTELADMSAYLVLDAFISSIAVDEEGEMVIVDVASGELYSFKPTVTGIDDNNNNSPLPNSFVLNQNYPNPFNPQTTISYTIDRDADIELAVFDITGKLVRNLTNSRMSPGAHQAVWDGRNNSGIMMASGIYLYRLKAAGSVTAAKRMVLLK